MADVFLSYARSSSRTATLAAEALRAAGFDVWFDESLPGHRAYSDVIEEQLENARAVLVLWSADAANSQWVRSEANRARESGRLVQVRLDNARLPMPFDQIQCADLRGWKGNRNAAWESVLASVSALAGQQIKFPRESRRGVGPVNVDRRTLVIGAGTIVATLAAGSAAWRAFRKPGLTPEAELLLQKGMDALQANDALDPEDAGSTGQAVALLTEATRAAPQSATAWGGLALAYAVRRRASPPPDRPGLEARGREAARTALRLDPNEPRALASERIMDPLYRNWAAAEEGDRRALARNPGFPILLFVLSDMLGSVGRYREASEFSKRLDRKKFLLPGAERKAILNLWSAGEFKAADDAIDAAVERWPDQRQIWRTRVAYLLYSGRASEALAVLGNVEQRPRDLVPGMADVAMTTARALVGSISRQEAIAANLAFIRNNPASAMAVLHAVTALGDLPSAVAMMRGYYFGEGEWRTLAPLAGDEDRQTSPLFQPPMRALWRTPEYNRLLERIGLNAYWRSSRIEPDFRRAS